MRGAPLFHLPSLPSLNVYRGTRPTRYVLTRLPYLRALLHPTAGRVPPPPAACTFAPLPSRSPHRTFCCNPSPPLPSRGVLPRCSPPRHRSACAPCPRKPYIMPRRPRLFRCTAVSDAVRSSCHGEPPRPHPTRSTLFPCSRASLCNTDHRSPTPSQDG